MYIQTFNEKIVPKAKKTNIFANGYSITLNFNGEFRLKLEEKLAKKLLKHYEMVESARKLYSEGKAITWNDFLKNVA